MAVPSSGELELRGDIALEVYGTATGNNISLGTMSNLSGFSDPDTMSEFYGYISADAPSVTTNAITNIGETTMRINGNVTSDGGATITERGFYFGTNSSSPTNNTKYVVSGTTGSYTNNRTGLSTSTTYYCWAYATNSKGTTYGSRLQASTFAAFVPQFVSDQYWQIRATANVKALNYVPANTSTLYYNRSYKNPNTNSWVPYYSASAGNPPDYNPMFTLYGTAGTYGACTNARNRDDANLLGLDGTQYSADAYAYVNCQAYEPAMSNYSFGAGYSGDTFQGDNASNIRVYCYSYNTNYSDNRTYSFIEFDYAN